MSLRISDSALQEKIGFSPFPEQQKVIDCQEREVVLCAGRRFGKSAVCAYIALRKVLDREKEIAAWKPGDGPRPLPARVWIVSPSYDLSQKVFNYLVRWFTIVAPSQKAGISMRPYPRIKTAFASEIECKSAENPTSLLGEEVDLLIVDEAAFIKREVYDQYLYATTINRRAQIIFISTPFGKNWFYEKYVDAKSTKSAFQFESRVSPSFPDDEWKRLEGKLPERIFKMWYGAQFTDDTSGVFRGVDEIVSEHSLEDVRPDGYYVMGVDIGKFHDFTVLTVIDKMQKKVVYWDRFNQINYPFQKKRIMSIAERYNHARVIVDSTGVGQPIKDDLQKEGLLVDDVSFTNKSKAELIEKLSIFIEQKHVTIPAEDVLIDELKVFGYQLTDSGNVKYGAPDGLHDDAVISLALAVWGLRPGEASRPKNVLEQIWEKDKQPRKQARNVRYNGNALKSNGASYI